MRPTHTTGSPTMAIFFMLALAAALLPLALLAARRSARLRHAAEAPGFTWRASCQGSASSCSLTPRRTRRGSSRAC